MGWVWPILTESCALGSILFVDHFSIEWGVWPNRQDGGTGDAVGGAPTQATASWPSPAKQGHAPATKSKPESSRAVPPDGSDFASPTPCGNMSRPTLGGRFAGAGALGRPARPRTAA